MTARLIFTSVILVFTAIVCTCRETPSVLPQPAAFPMDVFTDADEQDFEAEGSLSAWHIVGFPQGSVTGAKIKRTVTLNNKGRKTTMLDFSYTAHGRPVPVLYHFVLLREFTELSFRIKSAADTTWVVVVEDTDKAVFAAFIKCRANTWQTIELTPADFSCTDDSPVQKDALDPALLTYGYAGFDLLALTDSSKKNTVLFDDVRIRRASYHRLNGDYIIDAKKETITVPTYINGNLSLKGGGELEVKNTSLIVSGKILIDNGRFSMKNGFLRIKQDYRGQHPLYINNGSFEITNSELLSAETICGAAAEHSRFRLSHVKMLLSGFSFSAVTGSSLSFDHTEGGGEFITFPNTTLDMKHSSGFIFWICSGQRLEAPLVYPSGDTVALWQTPPALTNRITLTNCSKVLCGFIALPGCRITLKDSGLRALGLLFTDNVDYTVRGLKNKAAFSDYTVSTGAHTLRLLHSTVQSWNFYADNNARLSVEDCVYGESISMGTSTITVTGSTCDGSGGYLGAEAESHTILTASTAECMVLAQGSSRMKFDRSVVNGKIIAADNSRISLHRTKHTGEILVTDRAKITK
jgi:hypothetical protein